MKSIDDLIDECTVAPTSRTDPHDADSGYSVQIVSFDTVVMDVHKLRTQLLSTIKAGLPEKIDTNDDAYDVGFARALNDVEEYLNEESK